MTTEELHSAIRSRFKAQVADVIFLPTQYDNARFTPPENAAWARVNVLTGETAQQDLGSPAATRERTVGVLNVGLFGPLDQGDRDLLQIVDTVRAAFRRVTVSGVTFRTPTSTNRGRDGGWWSFVVDCPFYADSIP